MDLATLLGMIGALLVVLLAVMLGGSAGIFLNVPSLLIVLGGTLLVVMMKFSLSDFLHALKVASRAFKYPLEPPQELIETIVEMSQTARRDSMLALENMTFTNTFLQDAVQMLVDGIDRETVHARMVKQLAQTSARHAQGAQIFYAAADVAPAMGMIGTLIGLVQMLSAMDDPKAIGPAMAVALLTTLYGAILANIIAKPIGDKLSLRRQQESKNNALLLDGIGAIQDGLNHRVIETLLEVYISPTERRAAPGIEDPDLETGAAEAAA